MANMNVERFARQCESPACSHRRRLWRAWLEPRAVTPLMVTGIAVPSALSRRSLPPSGSSFPAKPQPPAKAHRVPLGLLMLSRGLVDNEQLKKALKAQKDSGSGRVGEWLRHIGAVSEEQVTQDPRLAVVHPGLSPQPKPAVSGVRPSCSLSPPGSGGNGSGPPHSHQPTPLRGLRRSHQLLGALCRGEDAGVPHRTVPGRAVADASRR